MTPHPTPHRIPLRQPAAVSDVSAEVFTAAGTSGPVIVLAHGARSRLDHDVHRGVAGAIAGRNRTVVTFNFPYAEVGRRSPDPAGRLLSAYEDVLSWAATTFPRRPLFAGGRSMGGRMASLLAAGGADMAGLVLLNYPLMPAGGSIRRPRVDHWPDLCVPVLFVHGSRDRLFPPDVFDAHRALLRAPVSTHVVDDADHVFGVPKRTGRPAEEVYEEVAGVVDGWLERLAVAA